MSKKTINKSKQRIIDAAIEVIKEKSVKEATVREIALRAGLTTGAVYYNYKNKDELFYDVMNYSIHFIHKLSEKEGFIGKDKNVILSEVKNEVILRLLKIDEQKLHVLLMADVISKGGDMQEKYKSNYDSIIDEVADMYFYTFGIENEDLKKVASSIFVAALDGLAMQYSLGIFPDDKEKFMKLFNDFFSESIPLFLENHR